MTTPVITSRTQSDGVRMEMTTPVITKKVSLYGSKFEIFRCLSNALCGKDLILLNFNIYIFHLWNWNLQMRDNVHAMRSSVLLFLLVKVTWRRSQIPCMKLWIMLLIYRYWFQSPFFVGVSKFDLLAFVLHVLH